MVLDDDPPENGACAEPALAVAQERIRGLEEQVALLQGQLEAERERYTGLLDDVKGGQIPRSGAGASPFPVAVLGARAVKVAGHDPRNHPARPKPHRHFVHFRTWHCPLPPDLTIGTLSTVVAATVL